MGTRPASKYIPLYMLEKIRDNFYRGEHRKDGTCIDYDPDSVEDQIASRTEVVNEKRQRNWLKELDAEEIMTSVECLIASFGL